MIMKERQKKNNDTTSLKKDILVIYSDYEFVHFSIL